MCKKILPGLLLLLLVQLLSAQTITITGNTNLCGGQSTTLHAEVTGGSYGTTSYTFEQYTYDPEPFTGGTGVQFDGDQDDKIAGPFDIGFTFCFFNQSYNQFYIGSNGWVGFTYDVAWTTFIATPIPNTDPAVPKNCIMAPWQDWWPGYRLNPVGGGFNTDGTDVFYYLTGTAPNRKLVVYWLNCRLYGCPGEIPAILGTFQIVLNEANSIVENHIQNKPTCPSPENATQGVHNLDGTIAFTATGRNCQAWTATNESTRFVPSGITWYENDLPPIGTIVGYGPDITPTPAATTTYYAVVGNCNGSSASDFKTVTVSPLPPDPIISGLNTACQGDIITYTTQEGMTGYTWTATTGNVLSMSGNTAQVQWSVAGIQNLSVTYKSPGGCDAANPGNLAVTVNAFETPVISGPDEQCAEAEATFTTQSGKSNYLWSYPGATLIGGGGINDNSVTLKWMTDGLKTVSVNYTDAGGCTALIPVSKTITVHPKPIPAITGPASLCISQTALAYTTEATHSNYIWSYSAGATNVAGQGTNTLTLDWSSAGSEWVQVTYTNVQNCTGSSPTYNVTINPLPVLNFPPLPTVCFDAAPVALNTASPVGGTYSGPGVTGNTFYPATAGTGTHTITYTYTDANGCTNTASSNIMVNPSPVVTMQPLPQVCISALPYPLTGGSPAVGTYSGEGVSGGVFNPALAGAGLHAITYTYTNSDGCTGTASTNIQVNPLPVVTLNDYPNVCITTPPFTLSGGSPAGGSYTGNGVSGGSFNPVSAGIGSHNITYTYSDINGCSNSAVKSILVSPLPDADFSGSVAPAMVCQDLPTPSRYQVASSPSTTYTWSIPDPYAGKGTIIPVPGSPNMVDVNWTGTGTAQLTLEAVNTTGCLNATTKNIIIAEKPAVTLDACFDLITTANAKPFVLKGGTPLGNNGKYYVDGTLVTGTTLDPATLSVSSHTISFTYTDANGCLSSDDQTLTVLPSNAGYQCFNGIFTDPRNPDNATNKYNTQVVTANGRTTCWMVRNLVWGSTIDGTQPQTDNCLVERYCPPGDNTCSNSGSFFQWDELMQYENTPGWSKGVCPPGWHIPTLQEWQDLVDANQGNGQAAGSLRENISNYSFHALLEGILYLNNLWAYTPAANISATLFWTSTITGTKPVARGLNSINPSVSIYESSKANAFPVRCVKD
jgi:uncharacterized protein (TIGR02145 family)